ncbi:aminotransferase class III-fold pyridoxal phosphate-dependent enzyme [Ralstonia solanacearum]|uniref:aspartate aminotransferase family protein n=1 Tax=Pseudomonas aeruginosa TaxID=287 RepID=UPI00066D8F2D|nr:aminotransferase class III-fold pyridoxal phosphate-dependent enzyme [Pseudomonas aeruginosa]MBH9249425.1 aminotransferase class III-fold pyridoxal phosphate-dependent enzyme [Pseudomonas aeruginosa]
MKLDYQQSVNNFSEAFNISKRETTRGKDYIPGGFSRRTFAFGPHAIFVETGDAQYIHTIDGRKLLDLNNNFSTNVLGHNHPAVIQAITEMLPNGFSFGNPTDHELELAKLICDRIKSIDQIKFSCSASEACLTAVRIARGYTGRNKIAKFEGGYHGFTDELAVSAHPNPDNFPGPDFNPKALPDSDGIPSYKTDNVIILVQNNYEACEKILRGNAEDIACVMMELQACAGGIVVLDKTFVQKIRALTEELGILLVVDETVTMRAAYNGLQSEYQIKPDLTVLGKMIGGGLPIGAVGGSREVFRVIEDNQVMISGTHHGHPMACAAGIACLKAMDKKAYERLDDMYIKIKTELNSWAAENNYPFIIFGAFSVFGFAFTHEVGQTITTHRDHWHKIDDNSMSIYALEMATRGYFPVHRGQVGLTLPMTDDDVIGYIETTKDVVRLIYSKD